MEKKFSDLTIHQKLEIVIKEMVDKEVQFRDAQSEFEKIFLDTAAKKYGGNKTKLAKQIGIHRNTLNSRAKILKIKSLI